MTKPTNSRPHIFGILKVLGRTQKNSGGELVVSIKGNTGTRHRQYSIPVLLNDTKSLAADLVAAGHFKLARRTKLNQVVDEILREASNVQTVVLSARGLSKIKIADAYFWAYVWNQCIYWFGKKPPKKVLSSKAEPNFRVCGTLKTWQEQVGQLLRGNPYLIVVVSHALAAALRSRFGHAFLVLLLAGPSSQGKTTAQRAAASTVRSPKDQNGVIQMTGSEVGFEELLQRNHDLFICLQDIKRPNDINVFFNAVFSSADGATRYKHGVPPKELSTSIIASNERGTMEMASTAKFPLDGGHFARCCEIYVDAPYGFFHDIHDAEKPEDFAKNLTAATYANYGAVWPAWLGAIADNWVSVERWHSKWLPQIRVKIAAYVDEDEVSAIDNRMLDALAFSAWVAVVAYKLDILPVKPKEILDAFGLVFSKSVWRRNTGTTPISDKVIAEVRGYLDAHRALFPDFKLFDAAVGRTNISGYMHKIKGVGEVFLFIPTRFEKEFCQEHGDEVYRILKRAGFLHVTANRGFQFQQRIRGTDLRKSFVAIKGSIRFD